MRALHELHCDQKACQEIWFEFFEKPKVKVRCMRDSHSSTLIFIDGFDYWLRVFDYGGVQLTPGMKPINIFKFVDLLRKLGYQANY